MSLVELNDVCALITDGTHYTPPNAGVGIPFLTVADMRPAGLNFATCSRITLDEFAEARRQHSTPRPGDVLFSKDGTVGKVHVVNGEGDFAVLSSIAILRPDPSKLDSRFLAHFLRTPAAISAANQSKTGSALRRIILKDIKRLRVNAPPVPEQKRIATMLDQVDALRHLRRESLSRLSDLDQSIFYEMFGDPVTNPKGWDTVRLGDLCEVGSSKRVFVSEFVQEGVPFYRGTEVGKLATGERVEPDLHISCDHYDRLIQQSGKPQIGDLLLPSICHDGRIWKVDNNDPFYFKDGRGFRPGEVNAWTRWRLPLISD